MSHNPFNPTKCEALEPGREIRKDLEQMNNRIRLISNEVEELQTVLYVEHDNEQAMQLQLEQARRLISRLATKINLNAIPL